MKRLLLIALIITAAFSACKKLDDSGRHDRLQKLLLKDTLQLYVGEVKNIPITISPSNYHLDSLSYSSSDTSVVAISDSGVMKAKKVGAVSVIISNLTKSISVTTHITVVPAPIDSLKLGLVGYYQFNNNAADSSGKGNNGTAYFTTSVADRFGNANSAYYFDGSTSYVSVPDNLYMRLYQTDFTESVWVKLDDYNASYGSAIVSKRIPGIADAGYTFSVGGYTSSDQTSMGLTHFGPGGGSANNGLGKTIVTLNQWHLLSVVYSYANKTLTIYVDGVLDDVTPNIAPPNATIGAKAYIGRDDPNDTDNGYFIKGALDDLRVYNRALSPSEILKLYNLSIY